MDRNRQATDMTMASQISAGTIYTPANNHSTGLTPYRDIGSAETVQFHHSPTSPQMTNDTPGRPGAGADTRDADLNTPSPRDCRPGFYNPRDRIPVTLQRQYAEAFSQLEVALVDNQGDNHMSPIDQNSILHYEHPLSESALVQRRQQIQLQRPPRPLIQNQMMPQQQQPQQTQQQMQHQFSGKQQHQRQQQQQQQQQQPQQVQQ